MTASRLYRNLRAKPGKAGKAAKPLSQKEAQRALARETAFHQRQQENLNAVNGTTDQAEAISNAKRDSDTLARVDHNTREQRVRLYNKGMSEKDAMERAITESELLASAPRPSVIRERASLPEIQPVFERPVSRFNRSQQRSNSLTQANSLNADSFRLGDWTPPPPRPEKKPSLSKETYLADLEASKLRKHNISAPSLLAQAQHEEWSFGNTNHSAVPSVADGNPFHNFDPAFLSESPVTSPFGTLKHSRSRQSTDLPRWKHSLQERSYSDPTLISPMNSVRRPEQHTYNFSSPVSPRPYRPFNGHESVTRSTSPTISDYVPTPRYLTPNQLEQPLTKNTSYTSSYFPESSSRVDLARQTGRKSNNSSPNYSELDDEELNLDKMRARLEALKS